MRKTAATRKLERDLETARAMYDALNEKLDAEYVRGNALSRDLTALATLEDVRRDLNRAKRRLLEAAESFDALGRPPLPRRSARTLPSPNSRGESMRDLPAAS
jgi:Fe-S-cluster formation regulator IscX/YfhJ